MEEITETEIDYIDLFKKIKKNWILIVSITIIVVFSTFVINTLQYKESYEASIKVLAVKKDNLNTSLSDTNNYSNILGSLISIANTKIVAEKAVLNFDKLDAEEYAKGINVNLEVGTMIIDFSMNSQNPNNAYLGVQAYQNAFVSVAEQYFPDWKFTVIENPVIPKEPLQQSIYKIMMISFVVGLTASVTFALLLEYFRNGKYISQNRDV